MQSHGACTFITAVTVLVNACSQALPLHSNSDSILMHICSQRPYGHIDIFVYSDTLSRELEHYERFPGGQPFIRMNISGGTKIVAAIADVQSEFNELPGNFDIMERITMDYADENPSDPLQSGFAVADSGATVELELSPLLCPVTINSICFESNAPLCDAFVQLERVNANAELFRSVGFHPIRTLSGPETLDYPFMMLREIPFYIGSRPQQAGLTLYCYPNEDEAPRGTGLLVRGLSGGILKEFHIPLGRICRGHKLELDIELKEEK